MTKWIALPAACVAAAALAVTVEAAPKSTAKSSSPKAKTTTKPPSTTPAKGSSNKTTKTSTSAKSDHAGGSKAKAPKSTTTTAKGNGSSKKASTTTTALTSTGSNSPSGTTTTTWQPTNAVAEKLMTKPNQLAKLKAVLPAGTDINAATAGFKNFGQLNAAVNVSQNLGINFADLKAAMTGTTIAGDRTNQPTKSLGQAIQQFKPGVDGDAEAAAATARASKEAGQ